MDVQQLIYFTAVVDHGGVTRAAESLYISQPSLSQAIRTLERRLDAQLFDRTGRRLELTEAGRRFDTAARRVLADVDHARGRVDAVRELRSGRVDVVTYPAFSVDPMVGLVRLFRRRYPDVVVRILDADGPDDVEAHLRRGDAEAAVTDVPSRGRGARSLPMCEQELVLVLPDALAERLPDPVPRERLPGIPLVVDLTDTAYAELVGGSGGARATGTVIDCAHTHATHELVTRSLGGTIMPRRVAEFEFGHLAVRSLAPTVTRRVGLTLRTGTPSPAAAAFASVAREWAGR